MRTLLLAACLAGLAGAPWSHLNAQAAGSVEGAVTNGSGAAVPNVQVELINPATGKTRTATTDSNGYYRFDSIESGHYRLQVGAGQPVESDFRSGSPNTVNLTVATISTDTLNAEPMPLQVNNVQVQRNWSTREVRQTPSANLLSDLGQGYGGYNLSLTSEAIATGNSPARGPAVGGQSPLGDNFLIDGADNNNRASPGPLVYLPNSGTQETTLFENQATPMIGNSLGGKFNSNIRSGTNEIHGEAYDYVENTHLNSIDQSWANMGLNDRPRFDQQRIGGDIGIPILPNKIFFFGNFEVIPTGFLAPFSGPMYAPTPAGFDQLALVPGVSSTNLGILRQAITNVGPASQSINVGGAQIPMGLVDSAQQGFQNQFIGDGGFDFILRSSDALHLRYTENKTDADYSGSTLNAFNTPSTANSLVASISEDHTFSPSVTNQLRFGYNRFHDMLGQYQGSFPGLNAFPDLYIGGASNLSLGPAGFAQSSVYNTYEGSETFGINRGGHDLRVGADAMWLIDARNGLTAFNGNYAYSSLQGYLMDMQPDLLAQQGFGSSYYSDNRKLFAGFAQDTWRIRPNLTVNIGVRYSYDTVPLSIQAQSLNAGLSVPGAINFGEVHTQTTNFAPNAGLAWSPGKSHSTVFRAGAGMMYDALYDPYFLYGSPYAPQLGGGLVTATGTSNTPGFLADGGIPQPTETAGLISSVAQISQKLPYSIQWNAGVEHMLGNSTVINLRYLGAKDTHLPIMEYANQVSPVTASQNLPLFMQTPSQAQLDALPSTLAGLEAMPTNPLAASGLTNPITTFNNVGNSWYHALVTDVRVRTGAVTLDANYTWSHLIDEGTGTPLDLLFGQVRDSSMFDRRNRASMTGVYDMTSLFKKTQMSVLEHIGSGLTFSGTYMFQSAAQLPAISNMDAGLLGYGLGSPAVFNPGGTSGVGSGVTPLFNSAGDVVAYQANNPNARFIQAAPGMYAAPIRNAFSLDPVNDIDLAVAKRFTYAERWGFEIRADAYNLLNHPQYTGVPVNSLTPATLGMFSNLMVPGSIGFADPSMFLSSNPRTLQLALRVTF